MHAGHPAGDRYGWWRGTNAYAWRRHGWRPAINAPHFTTDAMFGNTTVTADRQMNANWNPAPHLGQNERVMDRT